ncbi:MAG: hypothetical protein NT008_06600 [Methylococcales bacterium]|nr:hypothetical protein [Methylococcales bacterium]
MNSNVVGLDLAKNIFHLFSLDADGKPMKKKLKRPALLAYIGNCQCSCRLDG